MSTRGVQNQNKFISKIKLKDIVLEAFCNVKNGSITIVKQDNTVIQVNVNETIFFDKQSVNENLAEGA